MSNRQVTKQLLATYKSIKDASGWVSVQQIADSTNLRRSTINRHVKYLTEKSAIEVVKELNFFIYRVSDETSEMKEQLDRLLAIPL
jgi:DNA-binding transcriptional ArsR family regulator